MEKRPSTQPSAKRHQCDKCQYSTDRRGHLKQHQRTHTGEKPFKCTLCGKTFAESGTLKKHYRTHTGEKPFKCSVCEKAFSRSHALHIHRRTHTGEKPFKCTVCKKAYANSRNLPFHQRTHTGEKPFKCTVCGKGFARLEARKKHEKTHMETEVESRSTSQSAAVIPSRVKQELEDNPSLATSPVVKVECEDEYFTPEPGLQVDKDSVKQEKQEDFEGERGDSQEFVDVEVWVEFLGERSWSG